MKTLKLLSLLVLALVFSQCGTTAPNESVKTDKPVVHEVLTTLDTIYGKFYDLAMTNLGKSPTEICEMTKEWAKTLPNMAAIASVGDSSFFDFELTSGLRGTFVIFLTDADGRSLTRGGGGTKHTDDPRLIQSNIPKSKNTIPNKDVMIFTPFSNQGGDFTLYHDNELDTIINTFKQAGGFTVKEGEKLEDLLSFDKYGLAIIETHGFPDAFFTWHKVEAISSVYDTSDEEITLSLYATLGPDGYYLVKNGFFRFAWAEGVRSIINWQQYLRDKTKYTNPYRLLVTSKYVRDKMPMLKNTIVLGNMCYSGWKSMSYADIWPKGKTWIADPIQPAFMSKNPITYYYYGYNDGTSAKLSDYYAKKMEDSLVKHLVRDGDSTGHAHLDNDDNEYKWSENDIFGPGMLFKQSGHVDYSYENCVDSVVDERDGHVYKTFCIGKQTWMAENLNFNAPGSVTYNNDPANGAIYGRLYSYNNLAGICPKGWHVPSYEEFDELETAISQTYGGSSGGAMKAVSPLWNSPNLGATNISGFSALPGGNVVYISDPTSSDGLGYRALFVTTSIQDSVWQLWGLLADSQSLDIFEAASLEEGASCRCLKDK